MHPTDDRGTHPAPIARYRTIYTHIGQCYVCNVLTMVYCYSLWACLCMIVHIVLFASREKERERVARKGGEARRVGLRASVREVCLRPSERVGEKVDTRERVVPGALRNITFLAYVRRVSRRACNCLTMYLMYKRVLSTSYFRYSDKMWRKEKYTRATHCLYSPLPVIPGSRFFLGRPFSNETEDCEVRTKAVLGETEDVRECKTRGGRPGSGVNSEDAWRGEKNWKKRSFYICL